MGSIIHRQDFFSRLQAEARVIRDIERVKQVCEREILRIEAEWKAKLNAKRERINGLLTKINQEASS